MLGPLPSALCSLGRKSPLLTYDSGRTEYKSGFAATIRLTRASISALTGGRPPVGPAESLVQYSRKRRRCHRRTVFASRSREAASIRSTLWRARPRRADQFGVVGVGPWFACRRRVAGARPGSRERAGSGRQRGRGGAEAGGA